MNDVRTRQGAPNRSSSKPYRTGGRDLRISLFFLLWLLAAPFVGFALAGRAFDLGGAGDWEVWKAAALGALLMIPFAGGAYFGLRSVRSGFRRGWIGLIANTALAIVAIAMPILEGVAE